MKPMAVPKKSEREKTSDTFASVVKVIFLIGFLALVLAMMATEPMI